MRAAPARFDGDVDAPRAGVERVLDQLLHRRSRPLDHFAGGDAVDQQRIEAADFSALSRPPPPSPQPSPASGRGGSEGFAHAARQPLLGRPTITTDSAPSPNRRSPARLASAIVTAAMRALRSTSQSGPWPSSWMLTSWPAILVEVSKRSG